VTLEKIAFLSMWRKYLSRKRKRKMMMMMMKTKKKRKRLIL
jgi:hypothetical protein